jgi:hypothetical protein
MAGYTYTTYRTALQTLLASQDPDAAFDAILPSAIDYAEQRIYRELDLISTVTTDTSTFTDVATRLVEIPNRFVVVNDIAIFTPAGSTPDEGSRVSLVAASRSMLDVLWPSAADTGQPQFFSMVDQWSMVLGPSPDGEYQMEIVGTQRPEALSATNDTTFISERLPDLFLAASMVFMSGYQRNFGAQANDPQMGTSWEAQYQALKASADVEEARKHFRASAWTSQPVPAQATPPRG